MEPFPIFLLYSSLFLLRSFHRSLLPSRFFFSYLTAALWEMSLSVPTGPVCSSLVTPVPGEISTVPFRFMLLRTPRTFDELYLIRIRSVSALLLRVLFRSSSPLDALLATERCKIKMTRFILLRRKIEIWNIFQRRKICITSEILSVHRHWSRK